MTKYIQFKFTDGLFRISTHHIARDRAMYYANNDTGNVPDIKNKPELLAEFDRIYQEEYTYSMKDDLELIDWVRNNMNWEDLEADAFKVDSIPVVPHNEQWKEISRKGNLEVVDV